jgi:hypothetical protein
VAQGAAPSNDPLAALVRVVGPAAVLRNDLVVEPAAWAAGLPEAVGAVRPAARAAVLGAWAAARRVETAAPVGVVAPVEQVVWVGAAVPAVGQPVEPGVLVALTALAARALDVR